MFEGTNVDITATLWVEVSSDGTTWRRARNVPAATETGRNCRELRAILASYAAVLEAAASRHSEVPAWLRIVAQNAESGIVLGVIPRRWNADAERYESTGGEWMVTDDSTAYQAWCLALANARLTAAA